MHVCMLSCSVAIPWTVALQVPFVHGIFPTRILEQFAISSSRGSSQPRDRSMSPALGGGFFTIGYKVGTIAYGTIGYRL